MPSSGRRNFCFMKRSPQKKSWTPEKRINRTLDSPDPSSDSPIEFEHGAFSPIRALESLSTDGTIYSGQISNQPRIISSTEGASNCLDKELLSYLDATLLQAYMRHVSDSDATIELGKIQLFNHQIDAIDGVLRERCSNVCIATSTSSGKSLAFNIPVLSELIKSQGEKTALYIYPTKALTQDQKRVIDAVLTRRRESISELSAYNLNTGILDGDVKVGADRREVMESCSLILTNPDMLHVSILPNHKQFASFLSRLEFVVLDEAHSYNGAFGSHVSSVLRRLRRVVKHYRKNPRGLYEGIQFISCSATIGNPAEHVSNLVGIDCDKLVEKDGSPSGERVLTVWNSHSGEFVKDIVSIVAKFLSSGVRFICFCKNRNMIELILKQSVERLRSCRKEALIDKIVSYRAGYSPEDRRSLEQRIFNGEVYGVIATSALELGLDIGSLDVSISCGFPGSVHSLWQQWGRAGRGSRPSLCLVILREEDVLDSWLGQDADGRLLQLEPEDAIIQVNNPTIVKSHLICSDIELRFKNAEEWRTTRELFWPDTDLAVVEAAKKEAPFVNKVKFSIRNIESRKIQVKLDNFTIDEYDLSKAFLYIYPGAVHFVQGVEYKIVDLSISANMATAVKAHSEYLTRPDDRTSITPAVPSCDSNGPLHRGRVDISTKVVGFYKINRKPPHELVPGGYEDLELPTIKFATNAVWFDPQGVDVAGLHGAAHAIFSASCQKLLLSSVSDIKCDCSCSRGILIYDVQIGCLGAAEAIYKRIHEILRIASDSVETCPCSNGCPKCILLYRCGNNNEGIDKSVTRSALHSIRHSLESTRTR